jgi:hypothetical protein
MVATQGPRRRNGRFEITHTFGWYPLQQYLDSLPRRADAVPAHCLGCAGEALVPPLPGPPSGCRRLAVLDQQRPELERHVCRMPLHGPAKNYDPETDTYHHLVGDQRRLRSLPRSGLGSCGLGPTARDGAAGPANTALSVRTSGLTSAQQINCARPAIPAACRWTTTSTPRRFFGLRHSSAADRRHVFPDGQILDEVYVYGSFMQSKMYARGCAAATATTFTASSASRTATTCACSATGRPLRYAGTTIFIKRRGKPGDPIRDATGRCCSRWAAAPSASNATCPAGITWASITVPTTAFASPGRI